MANLFVTFGNAPGTLPIMDGRGRRTEALTISGSSEATTMACSDGDRRENCCDLYAAADCWVEIGADPTAVSGSGGFIKLGERLQYYLQEGDKVAVIAAS